jgi:LEA14-like dessication related protein
MTRAMRTLPVLLALFAVLAFSSCSRPRQPTIVPEKATIASLSLAGIDLVVVLAVTNPNSVPLPARSVSATVTLDGKYSLGQVTVPRPIDLPASATTRLEVPLSIKWTDVPTLLALAAQNRDVPYQIDGSLELGGDLLHVAVPFRLTGVVSHDALTTAALNSLPGFGLPGLR